MVPVSASGGLPSAREDARMTARRSSRGLQGAQTLHARAAGPPTCGWSRSTSCATLSAHRWRRPARLCARSRNGWAVAPKTNRRRGNRQARERQRADCMTAEGRSTARADELAHAPRRRRSVCPRVARSPSPSSRNFRKGCCVRLCQRAIASESPAKRSASVGLALSARRRGGPAPRVLAAGRRPAGRCADRATLHRQEARSSADKFRYRRADAGRIGP